ncbi:ribosome hibernation-promoting factor, HPF/YfiA family [Agaribacterium haliotis]|uniref:ribosome hibernation-promoting factor, HPF/YfiA family n=1 Tax=Agaribacterium haliotis TaxID=2013869 RepID=UPI001304197F|nr:ribosome-associated translation inhibitor RaiA [Agaribacterium haliotis]
MRVDVSGHHVQATQALRKAVDRKLKRIHKHFPKLGRLNAKLKVENKIHNIEIDTQYSGRHFSVKAKGKNMYAAIADASNKLHEALLRQKEHTLARRQRSLDYSWQDAEAS